MSPHAKSIHAYLFATAEPTRVKVLAERLAITPDQVRAAITELKSSLQDSGVHLVESADEVTLATAPEQHALIETVRKDELSKELSKASAETLSIVSYLPGIRRADIEFIRGVNVSYTIRALLMRGLIEARTDGRVATYYPTTQFFQSLGISSSEELPEYTKTRETLTALLVRESQE